MSSMLKTTDFFTTCLLKVNTDQFGWQKTIQKVLGNMHGVNSFRMAENGTVLISGTVDPKVLLKVLAKAGNKAVTLLLQSGQCSSNLFLPASNHTNHDPNGYATDHYNRYGHATGYSNNYGYNNYHQGGYGGNGGNRFLEGTPGSRPKYPAEFGKKKVVNHDNEREDKLDCCTIM